MTEKSEYLSEEAARNLLNGRHGKSLYYSRMQFVSSLVCLRRKGPVMVPVFNGSACFVEAGSMKFAVTAAHVVRAINSQIQNDPDNTELYIGSIPLSDWEQRVISCHDKHDLATFRVSPGEVSRTEKMFISLDKQATLQRGHAAWACGFPAMDRRDGPNESSFGLHVYGGVAQEPTDNQTLVMFEDHQTPVIFNATSFNWHNFDPGGMSGGPVFSIKYIEDRLVPFISGIIKEGGPMFSRNGIAMADIRLVSNTGRIVG